MKHNQDSIEHIINSMHGSRRAQAPDGLFEKIEANIERIDRRVIEIIPWTRIAAACAVILFLNTVALQSIQNTTIGQVEIPESEGTELSFVSDYKIYD